MDLSSWALRSAGLTTDRLERVLRPLNSPLLRSLSVKLATHIAAHGSERLGSLEPRLLEVLTRPAACCPEGGPHYRFIQRYLNLLERPDGLAYIKRYLAGLGPDRAGKILESYSRMVALGVLRHELLAAGKVRFGRPAAVLVEVQLALYPACELACKGCYSAGDRDGAPPGPAEIAHLVDEAASCGAWAVHVVGKGEPFCAAHHVEDLLQVIEHRPHLMFSIATNGQWMPDDLASRIARLGNVLLLVGVDGLGPNHDARRGPGTYEKVRETLRTLRRHQLLFGYASMVSRESVDHVTDEAFIESMARAGCAMGIYSRYFPLSPSRCDDLVLTKEASARYSAAFERTRCSSSIPLLDFDEVEEHTGCRARAGLSVYIDGVTGAVSPCIRAPFSPPGCRIDRERGVGLADVLAHPFFERYRGGGAADGADAPWCGHDPEHELGRLVDDLAACDTRDERLSAYKDRWSRLSATRLAQETNP